MDVSKNAVALFIELVTDAAAHYTPFPMNTLLKFMLEMGDRQTTALERIESKLDRVAIASFKEGLAFLKEAQSTPIETKRKADLGKARDKFVAAGALDHYPCVQTLAFLYLGICYEFLSDERACQSLESARNQATNHIFRQMESNRKYRRYKKGLKSPGTKDEVPWRVVLSFNSSPILNLQNQMNGIKELIKDKEREIKKQEENKMQKPSRQLPTQQKQPSMPSFKLKDRYPLRKPTQAPQIPSVLSLPSRSSSFPVKQSNMSDLLKNPLQTKRMPGSEILGSPWQRSIRLGPLYPEDSCVDPLKRELRSLQSQLRELKSKHDQWSKTLQNVRECLNKADQDFFDIALCSTALLARIRQA